MFEISGHPTFLRRIILEINCSEEDISGNDSSEEDKSEEDNQLF